MNKEDIFTDHQGYLRFKNGKQRLVHRWVAYKYIYLKDRKKYPLEFKEYQVHHINKNKTDNKSENLELIPRGKHEEKHGIIRKEKLEIIYIKTIVFGVFGIIIVDSLANKFNINKGIKAIMFMWIFLSSVLLAIWLSREKEGVKYI